MLEGDTQAAREQGLRKLLRSLGLKALIAAIGVFFLVGVFAPNLVDRRRDGALALALACLAAGAVLAAWFVTACVREIRRYLALRRSLTRLDRL